MAGEWQGFSDRELKVLLERHKAQSNDSNPQGRGQRLARPASMGEESGRRHQPPASVRKSSQLGTGPRVGPGRRGPSATSQSPTARVQRCAPPKTHPAREDEFSKEAARPGRTSAVASHEQLPVSVTNGLDKVEPEVGNKTDPGSTSVADFEGKPNGTGVLKMEFSDRLVCQCAYLSCICNESLSLSLSLSLSVHPRILSYCRRSRKRLKPRTRGRRLFLSKLCKIGTVRNLHLFTTQRRGSESS